MRSIGALTKIIISGLIVYWLFRVNRDEFKAVANNTLRFFQNSWDKVEGFAEEERRFWALVRAIPIECTHKADLARGIERLEMLQEFVAALPAPVNEALNQDGRFDSYLAGRVRYLALLYASMLASTKYSSPSKQLKELYMSLALTGMIGEQMRPDATDKILVQLSILHRRRRQKDDVPIRAMLEKKELTFADAELLYNELRIHPVIIEHGIDPRFVVEGLMPLSMDGLKKPDIIKVLKKLLADQ